MKHFYSVAAYFEGSGWGQKSVLFTTFLAAENQDEALGAAIRVVSEERPDFNPRNLVVRKCPTSDPNETP